MIVVMYVVKVPNRGSPPAILLRDATAASSLGEVLHLGSCDEDDLYEAMDYPQARQDAIQDALAARHLAGGTLVLYELSRLFIVPGVAGDTDAVGMRHDMPDAAQHRQRLHRCRHHDGARWSPCAGAL
jgi:hypothetical protein